MNFPHSVKADALIRADGRCEGITETGFRCEAVVPRDGRVFDHIIADRAGGRPTLENCQVLCKLCDRIKFRVDITVIAKVRRQERTHVVGRTCSRRPVPGGRTDYRSQGFDGLVRDRDTGAVLSRPWVIDVGSL